MPIEVRHLTQGSAFQATAIMDVNLTIQDGEFIGVIGHTGSGKSTLVQHLNGLLTPTSGQVLIDGEDMNQKGGDRRRIRQGVPAQMVVRYNHVHPQLPGQAVHPPDEGSRSAAVVRQGRRRIVAGAQQQPIQQLLHRHPLPGL